MGTRTLIALGGLVVSSCRWQWRSTRRGAPPRPPKRSNMPGLAFRQMNEPVLTVKPQFSLTRASRTRSNGWNCEPWATTQPTEARTPKPIARNLLPRRPSTLSSERHPEPCFSAPFG
jgi:hypothetical protein